MYWMIGWFLGVMRSSGAQHGCGLCRAIRMGAWVVLLVLFFVGSVFGQGDVIVELPEVKAPEPAVTPIVLDGKLEEAEWAGALELGPFYGQFNRGTPKGQTRVKVKWDQANLYVGFDCKDPEPGKIVAPERVRDGAIFGDDVVEIMVNTRPEVRRYVVHHLVVSAANVQFDSRITPDGVDPTFNARWKSKVTRNKEGWQCEMVVPLMEIGVSQAGYWDVNFYRENPRLQEYTCWSPTYGPFHTLSRFGKILGIRSKIYGVQTVDGVEMGQVKWGSNTMGVLVNNRGKEAKKLVVGLDVESPDGSMARFGVEAQVAAGAVTRVSVPYRTEMAGKYEARVVLEEKETGRVLAMTPVKFEFAPVVLKTATRSGVIGKPFPVEVNTFLSPQEGAEMKVMVRLIPIHARCDDWRASYFDGTPSPGWKSLETEGYSPGVYRLQAKVMRNEETMWRGDAMFETEYLVQLDKDVLEEKKP